MIDRTACEEELEEGFVRRPVSSLQMPDEKAKKTDDPSPAPKTRPAHEAVGSNEFTETTGSYPIRLPKHPQRSTGGFILEKFKNL
jgi:hypothetical protein